MRRVVVLGRGGAGKPVFARRLGELTALPVTELDRIFWSADLQPTLWVPRTPSAQLRRPSGIRG